MATFVSTLQQLEKLEIIVYAAKVWKMKHRERTLDKIHTNTECKYHD